MTASISPNPIARPSARHASDRIGGGAEAGDAFGRLLKRGEQRSLGDRDVMPNAMGAPPAQGVPLGDRADEHDAASAPAIGIGGGDIAGVAPPGPSAAMPVEIEGRSLLVAKAEAETGTSALDPTSRRSIRTLVRAPEDGAGPNAPGPQRTATGSARVPRIDGARHGPDSARGERAELLGASPTAGDPKDRFAPLVSATEGRSGGLPDRMALGDLLARHALDRRSGPATGAAASPVAPAMPIDPAVPGQGVTAEPKGVAPASVGRAAAILFDGVDGTAPKRMTLRLHPASLGEVEVEIVRRATGLAIEFRVESGDALRALEAERGAIEEQLRARAGEEGKPVAVQVALREGRGEADRGAEGDDAAEFLTDDGSATPAVEEPKAPHGHDIRLI